MLPCQTSGSSLASLGYVDFDNPSEISIYPVDFDSKEHVAEILSAYNSRMEAEGMDDQVITYTDAETFIIGLCAGLIGIGLTLLLLIPGNALIHHLAGTDNINAFLPAGYAVILIALSVFLTLLGGLIPSRKAAKSDPVTALRTE